MDVGEAHVTVQKMPYPPEPLHQERPVDAQLVIEQFHRTRVGFGPKNRQSNAAGKNLAAEEHHHAQDKERDQSEREAADDKTRDLATP